MPLSHAGLYSCMLALHQEIPLSQSEIVSMRPQLFATHITFRLRAFPSDNASPKLAVDAGLVTSRFDVIAHSRNALQCAEMRWNLGMRWNALEFGHTLECAGIRARAGMRWNSGMRRNALEFGHAPECAGIQACAGMRWNSGMHRNALEFGHALECAGIQVCAGMRWNSGMRRNALEFGHALECAGIRACAGMRWNWGMRGNVFKLVSAIVCVEMFMAIGY